MKKQFLILLLAVPLCFLSVTAAFGQISSTVQINSSPNPVGSGARAMGMGGAFISIADDATAASWNPAGLIQLERPEISFVFSYAHRRTFLKSDYHPEMRGMNEVHRDDLNYFSIAVPVMMFDKNVVLSLNYQRLYDFYNDISFDYMQMGQGGGLTALSDFNFSYSQTGSLKALAPAFAIQLTPQLSVGMTFNFWTDNMGYDNEWEMTNIVTADTRVYSGSGLFTSHGYSYYNEKNKNFEGFNFNVGFLWRLNSVITIGGVFKSPLKGDFDRETYEHEKVVSSRLGVTNNSQRWTENSFEMEFPMSYGLGISFRLSDTFTVAFDAYRTQWSNFWVKQKHGSSSSPITGTPRQDTNVHDTTQLRLGCEYLFILEKTIIPLRLGVFSDPQPSGKHADDFLGVSIGTGIMIGNAVFDCAYVYRWGDDVSGEMIGGATGSNVDADQHMLYLSMIYHF